MSDDYCVVLTTTANDEDAEVIARALLEARLAACVQILDIRSFYVWEGETRRDPEKLLLIKTTATLFAQVQDCILRVHKYEVPEIIRLPVTAGLPGYLNWIGQVTRDP